MHARTLWISSGCAFLIPEVAVIQKGNLTAVHGYLYDVVVHFAHDLARGKQQNAQ